MRKWISAFLFSLMASAALAESNAGPYSVLPTNATARGGTKITFELQPFLDCLVEGQFEVLVDGVSVPTTWESCHSAVATFPAHAPGPVDVRLREHGTEYTVSPPIHYVDPAAAPDLTRFARILIPTISSGPGAFGSFWKIEGELTKDDDGKDNRHSSLVPLEWYYDVNRLLCAGGCPEVKTSQTIPLDVFGKHGDGLILFVPYDTVEYITTGALVRDVSREEGSWGAEMPIAREADFRTRIVLKNVTVDPRYRTTLRMYGVTGRSGTVRIVVSPKSGPPTTHLVELIGPCPIGGVTQCNSAKPAYAAVDVSSLAGVIQGPVTLTFGGEHQPGLPMWGFVSITNNDTQHVTTIRPQ